MSKAPSGDASEVSRTIEEELSALVGRSVHLHWKCEHLQSTGSFKARSLLLLSESALARQASSI